MPLTLHRRPQASSSRNRQFVCPCNGRKKRRYYIRNALIESFPVESTRSIPGSPGCRRLHRRSTYVRPKLGSTRTPSQGFCASGIGLRLPRFVDLLQPCCHFKSGLVVAIHALLRSKVWWASGLGCRCSWMLLDTARCLSPPSTALPRTRTGGLGQALSTRLACPQRLIREQPPLSRLGKAAAWAN